MKKKKIKRTDVCRYIYLASDLFNAAVLTCSILLIIAAYNEDANKSLGGIYPDLGNEATFSLLFIFIFNCVLFVATSIDGIVARKSLKKRDRKLWPHLLYCFLAEDFLIFTTVIFYHTNNMGFVAIAVVDMFIVLGCVIFGVIVHNDFDYPFHT